MPANAIMIKVLEIQVDNNMASGITTPIEITPTQKTGAILPRTIHITELLATEPAYAVLSK